MVEHIITNWRGRKGCGWSRGKTGLAESRLPLLESRPDNIQDGVSRKGRNELHSFISYKTLASRRRSDGRKRLSVQANDR